MNPIAAMTATELTAAIRARRVSSREALAAHIERVERFNPDLNAIVTHNPLAEEEARRADEALARGEPLGPLHGLPMTIKDCFETAGLRTTNGYEGTRDYVPERDAPVVAKIRAAGAVIIGKTNIPSLAGDSQTFNSIFGITRNPWRLDVSPGGSSGGEAASLAARMTPLGIGSDIGGSIRQPSHCCATFGLKPTEHLVSTAGYLEGRGLMRTERHMNTVGPMARSVDDLDLLLRVVAGADGVSPELRPVALPPPAPPPLSSLRIAVAPVFPGLRTLSVLSRAVEEVGRLFASHGARVEEALPPGFDAVRANELWGAIYFAESGAALSEEAERQQAAERGFAADSPEPILRLGASAANASLRQYAGWIDERDRMAFAWERFFDDWDVLICPPSPFTAPPHSEKGPPIVIDGQENPYGISLDGYAMPFNLTGHPGAVLPLGITDDGSPFGYQVVTRRWDDARLLSIASTLAQVTGPCPVPPGYE